MSILTTYGARLGLFAQGAIPSLSRTDINRQFRILKFDYEGPARNVLCGKDPILHSWLSDDPKAPVKGSELVLSIINDGTLPLSTFFDGTYLIIFQRGEHWLFSGFLVKDDCTEQLIDINHEIKLKFTDNLALLKEIPFNEANKITGLSRVFDFQLFSNAPNSIIIPMNIAALGANIGDTIVIQDTTGDGVYTIQNVIDLAGTQTSLYLDQNIPFIAFGTVSHFVLITPADLKTRLPLKKFIEICIVGGVGNQFMLTNVYNNLAPEGGVEDRILDDVYYEPSTFFNGNSWKTCHEVLTELMQDQECSFLQALGCWNLIRWDEIRTYLVNVPGNTYNAFFDYYTSSPQIRLFDYGDLTDIEEGLTESIISPIRYSKRTFKYTQPEPFLVNGNLSDLGLFVRPGTIGPNTYNEYEMTDWFDGFGATQAERVIRIVYNPQGEEIERYAVVQGAASDNTRAVESTGREVSKGGKIKSELSVRSNNSQAGPTNFTLSLRLYNGSTNLYVQNDGSWGSSPGYVVAVPGGDNTDQWRSVSIESVEIPHDGILYLYLAHITLTQSNENWYKNMSLDYTPGTNGGNLPTGREYKTSQYTDRKANIEEEVLLDDIPNRGVKGGRYLATSTGILRDRTSGWRRGGFPSEPLRKLHEIITWEKQFLRRKQRSKLEGNLLGLIRQFDETYISPNVSFFNTTSGGTVFISELQNELLLGDSFTISDYVIDPTLEGTYTVLEIIGGPPGSGRSFVVGPTFTSGAAGAGTVTYAKRYDLSPMSVIRYMPEVLKRFVFGNLTINYREDQANGSMWEMFAETQDSDSDLTGKTEFKYLYGTN